MRALLLCIVLLLGLPAQQSRAQNKTNIGYPATLTVAADGSGDYTTISEALARFRAYSPVPLKLYIKNGLYEEKIVIPEWLCNLTIEGESREGTIITYADYSGKPMQAGDSTKKYSTFNSYTLKITGNDIRVRNLTIRNTAGRVGQAVALHVEGDRVSIENCNLLGNQDTLLTANDSSRQVFANCHIEGTTDFIFGPATVIFWRCEIRSLSDSYITAASTTPQQQFGYVFNECRLTAGDEARKVYLGRPWRKHARTVFIHSELGSHIIPAGWDNWRDTANEKTAYYAEYENKGPGAVTKGRVAWSHQLLKKEYAGYTVKNILGNWQPPVSLW